MKTFYMRDDLQEIEKNYNNDPLTQQKSDLTFICECMKDGLYICDRKLTSRILSKCFIGSEAIDWMLIHSHFSNCKTRQDGRILGDKLIEEGLISPIYPLSSSFQDKKTNYYRFKEDETSNRVLNESILWPTPSKHRPPDVAISLLKQAIQLYLFLSENTNYFSIDNAAVLFSPHIDKFDQATAELQRIDIKENISHEDNLCFWINIFHLMEIHKVIRTQKSSGSCKQHRSDSFYLYNISGTYYTMSSIEYWVLRVHTNTHQTYANTNFRKNIKLRKKTTPRSPHIYHYLEKACPEISFILNFGSSHCPPITIYYTDCIYHEFQSIISHFIEDNIHIDNENNLVLISPLIYQYYKDFASTKQDCIIQLSLKYLPQNLSKEIGKVLSEGYKIKPCKIENTHHVKLHNRIKQIINE